MSNQPDDVDAGTEPGVAQENTNAYRAGFMSGYVNDNKDADPSVAGYMDGYFTQDEGTKPAEGTE